MLQLKPKGYKFTLKTQNMHIDTHYTLRNKEFDIKT